MRIKVVATAGLLALSAALGGCGGGESGPPAAAAKPAAAQLPTLVQADGSYPTVPLAKDTVVVKVIQNGVVNLQEAPSIAAGLQTNLEKMVYMAAQACATGPKPDFLLFNEFPLTGYSFGTRAEKLEFTIQIPGPETDQLGVVAMQCDAYLIFGSYARDPDWPGHILSINTVIDPNGSVVQKYWKTRNIKRFIPDGEIPTTTIENVRDRYRDMYGIEAEFPVLQTEFGNIAVSTVQLDPFVFAAFAMRGTEIMFRTATLFAREDVLATARFNNFYSAMSNIIFPPDSEAAPLGGGSLVVAPDGRVLAEAPGNDEMVITAEIPIAELRRNRRIPQYPLQVVAPVFDQYREEIPLNHLDLPAAELPSTRTDMAALLDRISRWLN